MHGINATFQQPFISTIAMMNPFTAGSKIKQIQQDVLQPLYSMYPGQEDTQYNQLLAKTGEAISTHQTFIEEVSTSSLVALIFKIIKLFGGADQLSEDDFHRFTSYVRDGGLKAMLAMLRAEDKEKTFTQELTRLDPDIRKNATAMLVKSRDLHHDFIHGFFTENFGSVNKTPQKLQDNFRQSDKFIHNLSKIAATTHNQNRD